MDRFRFEAFLEEFPDILQVFKQPGVRWQEDNLQPPEVVKEGTHNLEYFGTQMDRALRTWIPASIRIKRLDPEVLGSMHPPVLGKEGVPGPFTYVQWWVWVGPRVMYYLAPPETALEAAYRLGPDNLSLLLKVVHDRWCPLTGIGSEVWVPTGNVVIFKPEKAVSLRQRIEEVRKSALAKVQAEADF